MSKFSSTSLFPTVVIRGVQYLAGNNNENLQYEIGNQNIIPIKKSTGNINSVTTPDSKKFNSTFYSSLNNTSVSAGRKEYFSFPYAVYSQLPGFYEFSDSAGSIIKIIALNPEPSESNIAKYDSKDIEDYFNKLGFKNLKFISKPESLHSELIRSRQGTDLTKYFLILVLFLIISEVLYTRKLEKG
jgi:hypothetical protein